MKNLFFIFLFLFCLICPQSAFAAVSPIASYSFNEFSGLTVNDSSGNNNNGSISSATWDANGKYGSALSFNGTNSIVNVSDSNSLDLITGMTLEAWVKPISLSSWRNVITKERPSHLTYAMYANTNLNHPSGEVNVGGSSNVNVQGTSQLSLNAWSHIAVTFDGSILRLYVNGVQVSTRSVSGSITASGNPLRIGGNTIWGEYFNGLIDEVRIYNVALSASEIQTDMNTPINSPTPTINPNRPDHTIIVMEENRRLQEVLGVGYFTQLANEGALMVQSFASYHPSQPNYIQLFAGSNLGVTDNTCPPPGSPFSNDNLGNQLLTRGFTFSGYVENLPSNIYPCTQLPYVGYIVPWLYFSNIPSAATKNFTQFPTNYTTLPTVSIIIPNENNNSHDTTVLQASNWLFQNFDGYKQWAMTHNSLLIVHFDEDEQDSTTGNLIYTVFVGSMIKKGIYNQVIGHTSILSTIESLYGLPFLSPSFPITGIFNN